jgi:hypothetical protein
VVTVHVLWCLLQVANARELEGSKGMLGMANWVSEKLLNAAHRGRSNTREGEHVGPVQPTCRYMFDSAAYETCFASVHWWMSALNWSRASESHQAVVRQLTWPAWFE